MKATSNPGTDISLAFDGDLSTKAEFFGNLTLDLGNTYFIETVVVYNEFYKNWFSPREPCEPFSGPACDLNVDHNEWTVGVRHSTRSCDPLLVYTRGLEQEDQMYVIECRTEGSEVIITPHNAEKSLTVYEIVVHGSGDVRITAHLI